MACVSLLFSEVGEGGFMKGMGGSNYFFIGEGGGCNVSVSTDVVFPANIR